MIVDVFRAGSDIVLEVDFPEGVPPGQLYGRMRMATKPHPSAIVGAAVAMTLTPRAATADHPVGVTQSLPASQSAVLAPGYYAADVINAQGVSQSATRLPVFIQVLPPA